MSVKNILVNLAVGVATLSSVISMLGLWHEFTEGGGLHGLMHNLETWVVVFGYHTALIILAAAAVVYLTRKS